MFEPTLTGARLAMERLRGGGAVALFADDSVGGLVRGTFLGRPPHEGGNLRYAVQFSRATRAPIVPGYIRRLEGARFMLRVLEPIRLPAEDRPGQRRLEDIVAVMEPLILQNLDQWYFLHDRLE